MTEEERNELEALKAEISAKTARATKLQKELEAKKTAGPKLDGRARSIAALKKAREAKAARKERLASPEVIGAVTDSDELSPTDIRAIEEEARKEIRADRRKRAKADLKAAVKRRLEQEMGISEAEESIFIELGGNKHNAGATYIAIDGVRYQADHVYKVRAKVAEYMRELMQKCDEHQCEIEGQSRRYNRLRNTRMGPSQVNTPNSALLRV